MSQELKSVCFLVKQFILYGYPVLKNPTFCHNAHNAGIISVFVL